MNVHRARERFVDRQAIQIDVRDLQLTAESLPHLGVGDEAEANEQLAERQPLLLLLRQRVGELLFVDGTIAFSPLACTRRGCPDGSLDDVFFGMVSTARTATQGSSSTLILEGSQGRLSLQR